ncbi:hypothetical protein ABZS96_40850 [Streptomyces avermitilis]|uniref:hypothetical protein n=1 Tax=Streptomyces avermitilis TaxID=33903 RepID=UPI0033ABC313
MPKTLLGRQGLFQDSVDEFEGNLLGQLAEVTGREDPGGDRDGSSDGSGGTLAGQRDLSGQEDLGRLFCSTGGPVAAYDSPSKSMPGTV